MREVGKKGSSNDYHIDPLGRMVRGSLTMTEQEIHSLRDELGEVIEDIRIKELPMLKGEGFIVIDPKNPRFSGMEHATTEAAQEEANDVAYGSGKAIIYAPIGIVKPKRDVVVATPTELLKQVMGVNALPAGEVKPATE